MLVEDHKALDQSTDEVWSADREKPVKIKRLIGADVPKGLKVVEITVSSCDQAK